MAGRGDALCGWRSASGRSCYCRGRSLCRRRRAAPSPARSPPTACFGRRGATGTGRCGPSPVGEGCPRRPCGCGRPRGHDRWVRCPSVGTAWWRARPCRGDADLTDANVEAATRLGLPLKVCDVKPSRFRVEVAKRIAAFNEQVGLPAEVRGTPRAVQPALISGPRRDHFNLEIPTRCR